MKIITVNDTAVSKARRLIKCLFSGDTHESYQVAPFGDDSCPTKSTKGVKEKTDNTGIHAILGYFNRNPQAKAGEKRLYAIKEDGNEGFYIWFKNDGSIEMGGTVDNAVGFTALKSGFDQFRDDFNTFIQSYNTHIHPDPASGVTGVPTVLGTVSAASIDDSKKSQIKLL